MAIAEPREIKAVGDYLKAPYARMLMPEEDGTFVAEILEFPGCVAEGKTAQEAHENLIGAATNWIEAALGSGQEIPEPTANRGYTGKLAVRLPKGLHKLVVRMAEREETSINQFVLDAVAQRVGAESCVDRIIERGFGTTVSMNAASPAAFLAWNPRGTYALTAGGETYTTAFTPPWMGAHVAVTGFKQPLQQWRK